jgi:hypothetical protein
MDVTISRRKGRRWVKVGTIRHDAATGRNVKKWRGKVGRRALKSGRYRATMVATDTAGNKSAPKRLRFEVKRRR